MEWKTLIEEHYDFKEPWRASGKSLTIIVPIVAKKSSKRDYVTFEEVKEKVRIVDTGNIHEVKVECDVDKPVFIRGGSVLKGATQERTTEFGVVVAPRRRENLVVHCVHASKGIRPGAIMTYMGLAPHRIQAAIRAHRNQYYTWSAINSWATGMSSVVPSLRTVPRDDLVSAIEETWRFRKDLEEMLKNVPDYVNQVGVAVIDPDGVVGLELYDHPDSWKAFSQSVLRSFGEALAREDKTGIFTPNLEAAIAVIMDFIMKLEKAEKEEVFNKNNAQTFIIRMEDYVGEYTVLNGKTIHITVARVEGRVEKREPLRSAIRPRTSHFFRPQVPESTEPTFTCYPTVLYGRKWNEIIKRLEKPKTWTSLTSELKMSKATLSSNLKMLQAAGLVEKSRDPNGVTRYYLTALGHKYKDESS